MRSNRCSWSMLSAVLVTAALSAGGGAVSAARPATPAGGGGLWSDFDRDGRPDLAIGVPGATIDGRRGAGAVVILRGTSTGLTSRGARLLSQDAKGVADAPEAGDHFGAALAVGDFNGDGYGDLAIGVPDEDITTHPDAGGVNIVYGSTTGLRGDARQPLIHPYADVMSAAASPGLHFGAALASLDLFTAATGATAPDGDADLAIGMPGGNGGAGTLEIDAGHTIDPGRANGYGVLINSPIMEGAMGSSLAVGFIDAGPVPDLVVGAPGALVTCGGDPQAGAGAILLVVNGQPYPSLSQGEGGPLPGNCEAGDHLGAAVALGDTDGDGYDEIFIGVPGEDVGDLSAVGQVIRVPARANGTGPDTPNADVIWLDRLTGVGFPRTGDRFGSALAVGELGRTPDANHTHDDLVVGIPGRSVAGHAGAGGVLVLYGASTGLDLEHGQLWTQQSTGVADVAEAGDGLGTVVAVLPVGRPVASLVMGAPAEDLAGLRDAGIVQVLRGGASGGVTATGDQLWRVAGIGIGRAARARDRFGGGAPGTPAAGGF